MAYLSKENQVRSFKPKKTHKQTKKKKIKTPVPTGERVCAHCGRMKYLEIHHCFYGDKYARDKSSELKCVEWLCYHCHREQPNGVHGGNIELDIKLKKKHQLRLMNNGISLDEFVDIFGMSYMIRGD